MNDTAATVSAIAERRDDLAGLVANTNTAIGRDRRRERLAARALELLPSTLRKANTTFVNLRSTLDDLDLLVEESKPATQDLAPFFRASCGRSSPTPPDGRRPAHADPLAGLGQRPDRAHREAAAPGAADRVGVPARDPDARPGQPVIEYFRGYTPDFAAWFSDFGQVAANYDANGHYARVQPMFLPTNSLHGRHAHRADPSQSLEGFETQRQEPLPGRRDPGRRRRLVAVPFGGCDPGRPPWEP